ncbi:UvrB/UvrC motif-containing protein [Calderihabitans maritimus]|uniref:UvrB/UvrC protein n=1 Tax=Calderihabitans maritimus TaxID=1246530 RepID=A0A1Z5HP41_9FIRM|nr:UvrB/UvrC motif-containing protein [Calderihabitans maritimus]GAW91147.1 UvrB/UvrC protein [Calderihabitans maritimus]
MLCERCQQRPANVHITKIINGQKTEFNLCSECARENQEEYGFTWEPSFSIPKFLASLMDPEVTLSPETFGQRTQRSCSKCGLTYTEFGKTGKLGCDRCYETFAASLEPLFRRIHGSTRHNGKVPERAGGRIKIRRELEALKKELQALVVREEFEKAAVVRDKIKELEKKL